LLGAVVGQPGNSQAASRVKPTSKTPPTITGAAEVGVTLVATRGTWNGKPTSFRFAWVRCNTTGAACVGIGGATAKIYTPTFADVGHTLRVTVTAKNADGSTTATSAATGVVPPSGCPPGGGGLNVAQLTPPARLFISASSVKPAVRRTTNTIHLHFTVTACGGRPVQGASVFATAVPYNQFTVGQGLTGADGTIVLSEARRAGFPVSAQQHLLAIFVRAWKQGEPETGGISGSKVVAFHLHHR
jgi:hypothetical protein